MQKIYQTTLVKNRKCFVKGDPKESKRLWTQRNRHKIREINAKYRYERGGCLKDKEWQAKNKDKVLFSKEKYRLKRRKLKKIYTQGQWQDLKKRFDYRCAKCYKQEPMIKLTADHIIPITKWDLFKDSMPYECDDIKNIQPLCVSCNSRKNNKLD